MIMTIVMLLSSIIVAGVIIPTVLADTLPYTPSDNALHFYIRHWHSDVDDEALYQGDSNSNEDGEKDRYFVLVEGYIEPIMDEDGNIITHEFYMVKQDAKTESEKYIKYGDGEGENEMLFTESPYIESVDEKNGIIVLSKKPLLDGDDPVEKYAGLSISVGRNAVEYHDNGLLIKYDPYIHLVKGHAFYTPAQMIVNGAVATTVDGDSVTFEGLFADEEIDTAYVYTYLKNVTVNGKEYKEGNIVMSASNPDQACISEDDLPEGISKEDVRLSKFYSTLEGMHTEKSIEATGDDGRTFTSNLDVWYVEGHAPEVSLILDASGSMVSPTDEPTQISVYETDEKGNKTFRTDIKASIQEKIGKLSSYENSDAVEWDEVFLTDEELATILNPKNTDNSMVGVSGYNYYIYNGSEYLPLGYWEGVITKKADTVIDFRISDDDVKRGWPNELHSDLKLSSSGFVVSGTGSSTTGIVLDAKPTDKNFTVSFNLITSTSGDPGTESRKIAELLYIGPMSGSTTDGGYYRLIRDEAGNSYRLRGNQNPDRMKWVTDINNVFNKAATQRVTLVFNDGTVTSYIDGNVGTSDNNNVTNENEICELSDEEIYIILNGIEDSYDGTQIIIDDLYVFDTALSADQVKNITGLGTNEGLIGLYEFYNDSNQNNRPYPNDTSSRTWLKNSVVENHGGYASKLTGKLNIANNSNSAVTVTTVAKRGDGKTLGSINTSGSDWTIARSSRTSNNTTYTMSQTQAGWYFITHAGRFFNHYNLYEKDDRGGTGKRLLGIYGGYNDGLAIEDNAIDPHASVSNDPIGTGYTYTSTNDEPSRFYVDKEGNLRCFYSTGPIITACSYVYYLTDAQYVRTEVLRRAIGLFVTDLNAESPASKVSAVRFSTQDINYNTVGTTDKFEMLLLQDWTNDTIESTGMLSMNYGADSQKDGLPFVIGGARAYDYSTSRPKGQGDVKQYNYGLTGSTTTWSGIQSYINTLADTADPEAPKYLIIFTDGADDYIGNTTTTIKIKKGKDAAIESVPANTAAKELADYLKDEGYTIFTVLLDGDSMKEGTENFERAKTFLTSLSGRKGLSDAEDEKYFFSINVSVSQKKNDLVQELLEDIKGNYDSEEDFRNTYRDILNNKKEKELTYSDLLTDKDKEIIDKAYDALNVHTTDLLTDIFTDEVLKEIVRPLEGYTVKDYIDPRFDLQTSDDTVWHLNAGGRIVIGDGTGENSTFTVSSTSKNTIHLTGSTDWKARDPFLRYDAENDMYYLEWVNQTVPTSAVGADRLAIWTAQVTLKAKDDFIGGNAILTGGNKEDMNWVYHPGDLKSEGEKEEADRAYEFDSAVPFGYNASSGTDDMKKKYEEDENGEETGVLLDAYPSKGFPRTTVNVKLLPINTSDLSSNIYMGEAILPRQFLTDIKDEYITDSYYLEYLKRYAYQRYVKEGDQELKKELDMPLLDLLTEWLEIDSQKVQKEFSIPYSYLPEVKYDDNTGKVVLDADGNATVYNSTGKKLHEQDIVGILTYRWEQLGLSTDDPNEAIRDFVKDNTERIIYSLTVEFTPFQVGDTLSILNSAVEMTGETTGDDIPIAAAVEIDGEEVIPTRARDGIFASYLPIRGTKTTFEEANDFIFDREIYLNGDGTEGYTGYELITDTSFKWNKVYKPTEDGTVQVLYPDDAKEGDKSTDYGDATFLNSGRTLTAFSHNTLDVVSGDIILEMKMLIGELEEAVKKVDPVVGEDGENHFITTLTLNATRSFTDTDFVEKSKKQKANKGEAWVDYATDFEFTFELDYTDKQIADLKKSLDEPDADPEGYVRVYAKVKSIMVDYGYGEDGANTRTELDLATIAELPIGTYKFSLSGTTPKDENSVLYFADLEHEANKNHFTEAYSYFSKLVLRGLHTTNEYPDIKWNEDDDEEGTSEEPEITGGAKGNIKTYVANATSDKESATFHIGTSTTSTKRGNTSAGEKYYTDYRLGIIVLSTGMTQLTIKEEGALSNESFLYKVKGKTLGGNPIEITVSVQGGGSTTVELPPGDYTVEEISDWSWRYVNENTEGEDGENWEISDDWLTASTTLRYNNDDLIEKHKTVTYYHGSNEKVWLGSENHENNQFTFSETVTE